MSKTSMFEYFAFGLIIRSEFRLPHLQENSTPLGAPVILVRREKIDRPLFMEGDGTRFSFEAKMQHIDWATVGKFDIRGANEIVVDPIQEADENRICLPLLGPVMALLLHIRGQIVLHASAVSREGKLVAFLGDKMAGKSTTAAAFLNNGFQFVSDDLVPISCNQTGLRVVPSFPRMKLSEGDAAGITDCVQPAIDGAIPGSEKVVHTINSSGLERNEVDVHSLFLLQRGDESSIQGLKEQDALNALIRYSFLWRFGNKALSAGDPKKFMHDCATIARSGRVKLLTVRSSISRLPEAAELVKRMICDG